MSTIAQHRCPPEQLDADQTLTADQGKRFITMFIGGGVQQAGLALLADPALNEHGEQVKVAFVDTDANQLNRLPQKNKFVMDQIPAAALLEAIQRYPERFPGWEILGDLEQKWRALGVTEALPAGLMTRRELGPLVLLYTLWRRAQAWRNFLLQLVRELHQEDKELCWHRRNGQRKQLDLVVSYFFSSCGGTGSSLAGLTADMQRYLLTTDGGFGHIQFTGEIQLPGTMSHRATDPQALKANTYAFLLELMERYRRRLPVLPLGPYRIPQSHRPFQELYLYDEANMQKRVFASREELNDMIQQVWMQRNLGTEGREYRSRKVDYHLAYPNIFSAGGCCILEFPAALIEMKCALHSGLDWIAAHPLQAPDQDPQAHLREFLNQNPSVRDVAPLTRDEAGRPLRLRLTELQHLSRQALPEVIDAFAHQRLPQLQQTLMALAKQEVIRLGTALVDRVGTSLNQPGGPVLAGQFLTGLQDVLAERQAQQEAVVNRTREQRERQVQRVEHYHAQAWWQRPSLSPRQDYLAQREQLLGIQLEERRQLARLTVITQLRKLVETLHDECVAWVQTLTAFQQRLTVELEQVMQEALANRSVAVEWVVCPAEMDQMYQAGQAQALRQAAAGLQFVWHPEQGAFRLSYGFETPESTDSWTIVSDTGVAKHVKYFQRFWSSIREHTVEEILVKQGKTPEAVLTWLLDKAAPLVRIDDTTQIPAEKMLNILGSQTKTFWQAFTGQTGLSIVATGNPHRISMLSTLQGLNPLDGLMQSRAWQQAYEDVLTSGRSPHLFPDRSVFVPATEPEVVMNGAYASVGQELKQEVADGAV